jgi:hypothetical protein
VTEKEGEKVLALVFRPLLYMYSHINIDLSHKQHTPSSSQSKLQTSENQNLLTLDTVKRMSSEVATRVSELDEQADETKKAQILVDRVVSELALMTQSRDLVLKQWEEAHRAMVARDQLLMQLRESSCTRRFTQMQRERERERETE